MAIKKHKPTSPGRRFATYADHTEVRRQSPTRLTEGLRSPAGATITGGITSLHRGVGAKRKYRKIASSSAGRRARARGRVETTPTAPPTSRSCLRLRRQVLHPRPPRLRVGATVHPSIGRTSPRNCCRSRTSDGHDGAQRRSDARPCWVDCRRPHRVQLGRGGDYATLRAPSLRCGWCAWSAGRRSLDRQCRHQQLELGRRAAPATRQRPPDARRR